MEQIHQIGHVASRKKKKKQSFPSYSEIWEALTMLMSLIFQRCVWVYFQLLHFEVHTLYQAIRTCRGACDFFTAQQQSYLSAISSESRRSRWTRRTWFASLALYWSIWHFVARRSTSDLGWLAQATFTLWKRRNGKRRRWFARWNVDGSHNKLERKRRLTFSPLRPGIPRPGIPCSPCH